MEVVFESRHHDGAKIREFAVSRVQFVMRRLSWLVPRAKVRLSDVNGPRGGVDKCCHLELKTDSVGTVTIVLKASDCHSALQASLARATRLLLRNCQRRRDLYRSRRHPTIIEE
ncbi:MAG: HPF/RaiA family ribosome-associated protein [Betaproteobacteria bacterium]|nr:HPF/RaiA family ribosome-associated protein [Betaproteobacteria bacterium]